MLKLNIYSNSTIVISIRKINLEKLSKKKCPNRKLFSLAKGLNKTFPEWFKETYKQNISVKRPHMLRKAIHFLVVIWSYKTNMQ
jgi:DNA-binding transcriptional regulator GbsR (MarR family)